MKYTLKRECTVLLVYEGTGYRFDALSDFSFSKTFSKSSKTRKTLHNRKAKQNTYVTSQNNPTANISVLCTDTFIEGVFFEILGLDKVANNRYVYPETNDIRPKICELYIITKSKIYKISNASIEALDFGFDLTSTSSFDISFIGTSIETVEEVPRTAGVLEQGNPLIPSPIQFRYNHLLMNEIISSGLSFQQTIEWRNDKSIHNTSGLHINKNNILVDREFNVVIDTNLKTDTEVSEDPEIVDLELYKNRIYIKLDKVLSISRLAPNEVFMRSLDVSLTEQSYVYVEYGGRTI